MKKIDIIYENYIYLIYGIIAITAFVPLLKDLSIYGSFFSYIPDFLNVVLLFCAVVKFLKNKKIQVDLMPLLLVIILLLFDLICLFYYKQSILLFLWGFRNQYRFILFFIACSILCDKSDLQRIDSFLRNLLFINFIVVLIEIINGYTQDCLSGTFGITAGSNGSANLFLCICLISLVIDFLYEKINVNKFLFYIIGIFTWAAVAELKYFYILAVVIILGGTFLSFQDGNLKRIISLLFSTLILGFFSIVLLEYVRPYYKGFFSLDNILWYAKHIDMGVGGFGRLTAIPISNSVFFKNKLSKMVFGIGLGSAEYSSMTLFDSPFHKLYASYNYDTLFYAVTYIERGYFGLCWFSLFYLCSFFNSIILKKNNYEESNLLKKSILVIIIAFLLSFYDDSLRRAFGGYTVFYYLIIPYVLKKNGYISILVTFPPTVQYSVQ